MTVLRTNRLELLPASQADLDILVAHWNQPEVRQYLFDDREVSAEFAATLLADSADDFTEHGYGLWKAYLRDELVGVCGLRRHDSGQVEIVYSLEPARRGSGLATEAALAVLETGRRAGLKEILLETDEGNVASQRLARRLGAVPRGGADGILQYVISPP
ncbi:GNAT family N-acetyltransferase [Nonomuraea harbinensis]|uniref:GNAT family N-acetyltransferase n=1 Tax=Nonomuraea harbinensis TaxID=1286938 RepID=A0ABW1C470_9ACTN|nr:GNAT family N-acetyltransferase [Nonomuraea harbinensis]